MRCLAAVLLLWCSTGCLPTVPRDHHLMRAPRYGHGDTGLQVRVVEAKRKDCEREILGIVDVSTSGAGLIGELRRRATAMGGDRVVDVEYQAGSSDVAPRMSGLVARCSKLLAGRDYIVIRSVSVSAPIGDHRRALAAIASKARELDAHVLVELDYEQANSGGELRITGKAARYVQQWWGVSTNARAPSINGNDDTTRGRKRRRRAPKKPGLKCPETRPGEQTPTKSDPPKIGPCKVTF
jgi:hypothetical protein